MSDQKQRNNRFEIGQSTTLDNDGQIEEVKIANVSFGGVLVESDQRPNVGTSIKLIDKQFKETFWNVIRHTPGGFALTMKKSKDAASFALKIITSDLADKRDKETSDEDTKK